MKITIEADSVDGLHELLAFYLEGMLEKASVEGLQVVVSSDGSWTDYYCNGEKVLSIGNLRKSGEGVSIDVYSCV